MVERQVRYRKAAGFLFDSELTIVELLFLGKNLNLRVRWGQPVHPLWWPGLTKDGHTQLKTDALRRQMQSACPIRINPSESHCTGYSGQGSSNISKTKYVIRFPIYLSPIGDREDRASTTETFHLDLIPG